MITLKVTANVAPETIFVPETYTLREAFEEAEVDYAGKAVILDGAPVGAGGLNQTFAELGYDGTPGHDKAILSAIAKVDNA